MGFHITFREMEHFFPRPYLSSDSFCAIDFRWRYIFWMVSMLLDIRFNISGWGLYLASLLVRYFPEATVYGLTTTLLLVPDRAGHCPTNIRQIFYAYLTSIRNIFNSYFPNMETVLPKRKLCGLARRILIRYHNKTYFQIFQKRTWQIFGVLLGTQL